jgi:hypothetical protein
LTSSSGFRYFCLQPSFHCVALPIFANQEHPLWYLHGYRHRVLLPDPRSKKILFVWAVFDASQKDALPYYIAGSGVV